MCACSDGIDDLGGKKVRRTEMQLEVSNFKSVASSVFCESARKVRDRVDELICDVQKQLLQTDGNYNRTSREELRTHILHFRLYSHVRVYTCYKVLDGSSHALVSWRVLSSRTRFFKGVW